MENYALEVQHITKEYRLYESEMDRLKESFNPFKKSYHRKFFALDDVNFGIKKGEKVGIIGANGAGKSTLLKIVTGVLNPTKGQIITDGKIAALLELGAGFNQDYTGVENIRLNGTLMGYTDEEIEEKMKRIIEFADIGQFIDQPVKSYSSGMFVRLAFATQIFSEPDILIVDEALSVGDIRFQQKCFRAMESLMKDKTVVLVTHDTAAVTRFCERVIWINKGKVMYDGEVTEGLKQYQEFLINQAIEEKGDENLYVDTSKSISKQEKHEDVILPVVPSNIRVMGNGDAKIIQCGLVDSHKNIVENVEPGERVCYIARVQFEKVIERPIVGITIKDRLGNIIFSINSEMLEIQLPEGKKYTEYRLEFEIPELNKGEYLISFAIARGFQNDHVQLCWLEDVTVFKVANRQYDLPGFFYSTKGQISVIDLE